MTNKRLFIITASLLAASLGIGAPVNTLAAQSPSFARTSQEWASLEDNILEYDEIADLIHEYNPTVISNNYEYREFVDEYGSTNSEIASEYRDKASELENSISGEDDATSVMSDAQAELQAKQLRQQADNNTDDGTTKSLEYAEAEAQLVMTAKNNFVQYYSAMNELEQAKTSLNQLNDTLSLTNAQYQAGIATESEVRTAQKNVTDQENAVKKAEEAIEEARESLIIMFGWKSTDTPEIGQLPEVTADMINAIDLSSDQSKALENNYTLRINKRKLENAQDGDNITVLNATISGNEKSISVSVNSAYQSLKNALMSLEQAESDLATENKNLQTEQQRYSAGLSTQYEYSSQQYTVEQKEQAVEAAKFSLIQAYITYESYVAGLASAE